jgi:hypothetical protein
VIELSKNAQKRALADVIWYLTGSQVFFGWSREGEDVSLDWRGS